MLLLLSGRQPLGPFRATVRWLIPRAFLMVCTKLSLPRTILVLSLAKSSSLLTSFLKNAPRRQSLSSSVCATCRAKNLQRTCFPTRSRASAGDMSLSCRWFPAITSLTMPVRALCTQHLAMVARTLKRGWTMPASWKRAASIRAFLSRLAMTVTTPRMRRASVQIATAVQRVLSMITARRVTQTRLSSSSSSRMTNFLHAVV